MQDLLQARPWRPGVEFQWAHQKLDGHRMLVEKLNTGYVQCTTSLGTDITAKVHTYPWYLNLLRHMSPGHAVDGELWWPSQRASYVKHALAHGLPLRFTAFAIPTLDPTLDLLDIHDMCRLWAIDFAAYEPADCYTFNPTEWRLRAAQAHTEGWVLKVANYVGWWKLKCEETLDAVVTGIREGTGKYLGLVGALRVSVWHAGTLIEVASVGTGFSDVDRWELHERRDVGRVCEIQYQYVGDGGRLRHPRFVRWRDDKRSETCDGEQDPELFNLLEDHGHTG